MRAVDPVRPADLATRARSAAFLEGMRAEGAVELRALVRQVMASPDGPRVEGPIVGMAPGSDVARKLAAFRAHVYATRSPDLIDEAVAAREVAIDARSTHFVMKHGSDLLGSVRVAPPPFELRSLSSDLAREADRFAGYVELSRLAVQRPAPGRAVIEGTNRLLAAAVAWAIDYGARGVVALCHREAAGFFVRFGLRFDEELSFVVASRGNAVYRVMHGTWQGILIRITDPSMSSRTRPGRASSTQ